MLYSNVEVDFESKGGKVIVKKMRERRKGAGRKKVKTPKVDFDLKAIREIKERKKKVCKTKSGKRR